MSYYDDAKQKQLENSLTSIDRGSPSITYAYGSPAPPSSGRRGQKKPPTLRRQRESSAIFDDDDGNKKPDEETELLTKESTWQAASPERQTISKALRWMTNSFALLSVFLFSGIIFGWAPLKLILLREGQYYDKFCQIDTVRNSGSNNATEGTNITDTNAANINTCVAQLDQYNLIFTLAQFTLSFASFPVGYMLDHLSKKIHFTMATIFIVTGLVGFGISDSTSGKRELDYFVLSYILLSIGGSMTILGAFPSSFLLPNHQAGILAGVSCLFDASSIIFAVFYRMNVYNANLFSRKHLFLIYAISALCVYSALLYCWTMLEGLDWKTILEYERHSNQKDAEGEETKTQTKDSSSNDITNIDGNRNNTCNNKEIETSRSSTISNYMAFCIKAHLERIESKNIHGMTLMKQLFTWDFFLILGFASIHMLRCNYYIETVNEILLEYGDFDASYANMFSFVLPVGIIFVPFIEITIRHIGVINTLHYTNVVGIVFGVLLIIPSLRLQLLTFFIFTMFRAYLYATLNTFIAITFGIKTMGRIIGICFTIAAMVTLIQYPAASYAEKEQDSSDESSVSSNGFIIVNISMLLLGCIPIFLVSSYSHITIKEHNENTSTNTNSRNNSEI